MSQQEKQLRENQLDSKYQELAALSSERQKTFDLPLSDQNANDLHQDANLDQQIETMSEIINILLGLMG